MREIEKRTLIALFKASARTIGRFPEESCQIGGIYNVIDASVMNEDMKVGVEFNGRNGRRFRDGELLLCHANLSNVFPGNFLVPVTRKTSGYKANWGDRFETYGAVNSRGIYQLGKFDHLEDAEVEKLIEVGRVEHKDVRSELPEPVWV